jgi:hypothetical protein
MSLLLGAPPLTPFVAAARNPSSRRWRPTLAAAQQRSQRKAGAAPAPALAAAAAALAASPGAALAAAAAADPQAASVAQAAFELAALDSKSAGSLSLVLKPVLSLASLLMIVRIVMSWYPEIDGKQLPWSIAFKPTGERWG